MTLVIDLAVDADRMALNLLAAGTAPQTHLAVVALCDQGIAYLTAHEIVTSAVHTADAADLIGGVVTAAAARGIDVDAEQIRVS